IIARETIGLSAGAQSCRAVHPGAPLYVSRKKSLSESGGEPARTPFGALDEPGGFGVRGRDGGALRPQGLPAAPVYGAAGRRLGRLLVVLRAAPIRGSVLGAA